MQMSVVKKGVLALAALALLVLLFVAAVPWIASTQIVRDRIAYELGLWSGYRVSLGEAPDIEIWPGFKARLNDVAFHEWSSDAGPPVLEADRLEASLSALAALRGEVVMSAITLHRPLLRLTRLHDAIELPASPGGGRMMRAVEVSRGIVADNPVNPDRGALPDDAFGTVEFVDGRIAILGDNEGDAVSSLNGRLGWPALNRGARLTATGIWRGENIAVEMSTPSPLLLAAGATTPVKASLKSPLLEASFDGVVALSGDNYLDGQASLASPSLRRTLEWARTQIAPGAAVGAVSIASRVQGSANRLRLDSVALSLGGNAGRGVLDLSVSDAVPAISGTLALDRLDLRSFLSAFMPIAAGDGNIYDRIDTGFTEQLSLDLRLSAATATLGAVTLTDIAASAQVKGSLATFDISDATAFGGELQAGLRIDAAGETKTVEMRMMAAEIDSFAFAKAAGAERLLPQGRAALSAILKGSGRDWNTVMGNAEGSVTASLGPGALVGLDLAKFRDRWTNGGFFALAEVAGGTVPLRGIDFKAKVTGGVARLDKAELMIDQQQVLSFAGIIPYFGRALALSGHIAPVSADGTRGEIELPFFIGGAWDAPFVSPARSALDYE